MNIGDLRHRVDIIHPPTGVDERGLRTGNPVTLYAGVFASVVDLSGLELVRAQKIHAETRTQIKIRYHAGIDTSCTIVFGERSFHILHINDVEQRHEEQIILCNEVR